MSSPIISKHGSSSSYTSCWTTPRLRDSSTAKKHVSSCVHSLTSSSSSAPTSFQTPVNASSSPSPSSTSSLHAVLITKTPTMSSTRTPTSSTASATSTPIGSGGCSSSSSSSSSSSAFSSACPCSTGNSRWIINRKSCYTQLGYATPSLSTAGCHTNHQFLMPLMLTLTYADPHLFSMFMAMVAVAATATATVVAVAKSESSTPTSSCQQSRDTSFTKSRISVEDRVSLEKVASSPIPLTKTTATTITATRPKTTPPARTSWARNNNNNIINDSPTMTRCNENHTIVSDHHQNRHEHPANDHATVASIIEDHPHDILTEGIPEYFRFADPTGVYGILDEMDILTQHMENYPINLILAPGTSEKILSRNIYPTQCNDQANSELDNHSVPELITRSPNPILAL